MAELLGRFLPWAEKNWRHHRARWLIPGVCALLFLGYLTDYGKAPIQLSHISLSALLALAVHVFWLYENRVPQVPKGHVGLLLALVADDDAHDKQVRSDFVANLRQFLHSDQGTTKFYFIDLPQHHARECQDMQSAERILRRAKGHFLLFGSVRKRSIDGSPAHLLSLEGIVRHAPISQEVTRQISADFRSAIPRRARFGIDNDALAFEVTSEWTEVAARYVIGLAAFASGDALYAERLLLSVEERLRKSKGRIVPLQNVANQLPARLESLYANWINALYKSYYLTRRREFIEKAEPITNKLLARNPTHYLALSQSAINSFILRRDIVSAKRAIMMCRRVRNPTWRYSLAFLFAYEGNMRRAREEYHEAFQGRLDDVTLPVQVEEFIHLVLDEEPDKGQLLFCTAEINEFAKGDLVAARRDYEAFLASSAATRFPQEVEIARRRVTQLGQAQSNISKAAP